MTDCCIIYKIVNSVNNDIYIGQTWETLKTRFLKHKARSSNCVKLRNAINSYGENNFIIKLLMVCHTQEIADHWETFFIKKYDATKNGYNILIGGKTGSRKGLKHSEEARNKISISKKGKPSWNKGMLGTMNGRKHTKESKENMSAAAQLRVSNGILPMLGKHHSEASKQKSSSSQKDRVHKGATWKLINGKRVWIERT